MKKKGQGDRVKDIKVAVVCEPLYKWGGAELHLKYILEAFPNSELFTAYYDAELVKKEFKGIKVHHSFMQYLPWKDKLSISIFFLILWHIKVLTLKILM